MLGVVMSRNGRCMVRKVGLRAILVAFAFHQPMTCGNPFKASQSMVSPSSRALIHQNLNSCNAPVYGILDI